MSNPYRTTRRVARSVFRVIVSLLACAFLLSVLWLCFLYWGWVGVLVGVLSMMSMIFVPFFVGILVTRAVDWWFGREKSWDSEESPLDSSR